MLKLTLNDITPLYTALIDIASVHNPLAFALLLSVSTKNDIANTTAKEKYIMTTVSNNPQRPSVNWLPCNNNNIIFMNPALIKIVLIEAGWMSQNLSCKRLKKNPVTCESRSRTGCSVSQSAKNSFFFLSLIWSKQF